MIATLSDSARDALRSLRRSPGYASAVVATTGLATAAVALVVALVNGVLVRPLPFPDPDRLLVVWEGVSGDAGPQAFRVAAANYVDWRDRSASFSSLGLFSASMLTITGAGDARELRGVRATASYFQALGVRAVAGRLIEAGDESPAAPQVVVLSHGLWTRRFGGRSDAIGSVITLGGQPHAIAGVMPKGIYPAWPQNPATLDAAPESQEFWVPMRWTPQLRANRGAHVFGVVGRLAPGVSIDRARAELGGVAAALAREYPATNQGAGVVVDTLADEWTASARSALLVLLGSVLLVWLLAAANLAGLATTRAAGRRLEGAVRTALGATRTRLVGHVFAESLVISMGGGVAGLILAAIALPALLTRLPDALPRPGAVAIGLEEAAAVMALSLAAAVVLAAASLVSWHGGPPELAAGARTSARGRAAHRTLIVVQVALAMIVTLGAGLLIRSFARLTAEPSGFEPAGLVVADLSLATYRSAADLNRVQSTLADLIGRIPGVEGVTFAYDRPFEATWSERFRLDGDPPDASGDVRRSAWLRLIGVSYFETLRLPIVEGRGFDASDAMDRPGVAVVNERFARAVFGAASPLGRILEVGSPRAVWGEGAPARFEIVGVAGDARFRGLEQPPEPAFYLPLRQFPDSGVTAIIRSSLPAAAVAADLQAVVRRVNPAIPVERVGSVESTIDRQLGDRRLTRDVLTLFGAGGLGLAALGLFGVLALSIAERTRELGVRLALGATPGRLGAGVVVQAVILCGTGIVLGGACALGLARLARTVLYGVSPADPVTIVSSAIALMSVAILASWVPAHRAAATDPVEALRR
jgi:predicted permease